MTQPLCAPDPAGAAPESAAEFWPVAWVARHEHDQMVAACRLLARSVAELAPWVGVGALVQVGGGEPPSAWVVVRHDGDPEGPGLVASLLGSLLPGLGLDRSAAVAEVPRLSPQVGLAFSFGAEEGEAGPVPFRSRLLDVLGRSAGRWQLTIGTGLAVPSAVPEDDEFRTMRFDVSASLIGTGPEGRLAAALLAMDVSTPEAPVAVAAREVTGERLRRLEQEAAAGVAPPSGLLDPANAGRLLSLPWRAAEGRPPPVERPAPPEATARLFNEVVPPHVLVLGGSGQGKTTLLHHAAMDAVRSGRSTILVLSPHGDLVARLAASIHREGHRFRVLHFGGGDPLRWNVMRPDPGADPGAWAGWLARIIRRLWPEAPAEFFGPVWERMSRLVLEILIADPEGPHPITELPAFFARESAQRDRALARIRNERLTRSVQEELVPFLSARDAGNAAVWVLSKIEGLVGNPAVARVVGSAQTEVDVDPTLQGAHTIVSAPLAELGDDGARLLGSVLIDQLWRRARATAPLRPVEVFIDEWHRLATPAVGEILAEGRKFGLRLRLANQNASQVDAALWDTALANVGALVTFRTGPRDAALLDPMFPSIRAGTLTRLPPHWVAATTGVDDHVGTTAQPLPGGDDPQALLAAHDETRRAAAATAADRGMQLALAFPPDAPAPAAPSFLDEWLEKRRAARVGSRRPVEGEEDEEDGDEEDGDEDDEGEEGDEGLDGIWLEAACWDDALTSDGAGEEGWPGEPPWPDEDPRDQEAG
jgi:PAS domain-containing protein